jgi:CheY-like chemotaxis protein
MQRAKIAAVLSDLMFMVKIQEAAKRAGVDMAFAKSHEEALALARLNPAVMILDLNATSFDALDLIAALKADPETSQLDLIAFVSHVQTDLKQAAQQRGCNTVIARSAFSQSLPAILKRYGEAADIGVGDISHP